MIKSIQKSRTKPVGLRNSSTYKYQLYQALLHIYKIFTLKDLSLLKQAVFLNICELQDLQWDFCKNQKWLTLRSLKIQTTKNYSFCFSCSLNYKSHFYGKVLFFSSRRFLQTQKRFLKKISDFISAALYFIENKEKSNRIKEQWGGVFDSFSQAFCITNTDLQIIKFNESFQKISKINKKQLFKKNLLNIFSISKSLLKIKDQETSFILTETQTCWKVSCKSLFLKKQQIPSLLFLITDITQEIKMAKKLQMKSKEQEMGFIVGSIAHELNNPIAGMQMLLEVLDQKISKNNPDILNSIKQMKHSTQICKNIINKLLSTSQEPKDDTVPIPVP